MTSKELSPEEIEKEVPPHKGKIPMHWVAFAERIQKAQLSKLASTTDKELVKDIAGLIKTLQDSYYSVEHSPCGVTVYDYIAQGIYSLVTIP